MFRMHMDVLPISHTLWIFLKDGIILNYRRQNKDIYILEESPIDIRFVIAHPRGASTCIPLYRQVEKSLPSRILNCVRS